MSKPRLREIFDRAASEYDQARPGYPAELFDDLIEIAALPAGGRILEIGPGTGKATLPLAERSFQIHGVELGGQLAAEFQRKFGDFPNVDVTVGPFETAPIESQTYDLVMAATAFHWLDQPAGYQQCHRALKPTGSLAIFRHEHVGGTEYDEFFHDTQRYYEQYMPGTPPDLRLPQPDDILDQSAEIEATNLFGPTEVRHYLWNQPYDAESYLKLLSTYSGHIALPETPRRHLFEGIADLINNKYRGEILKTYLVILHVARRQWAGGQLPPGEGYANLQPA